MGPDTMEKKHVVSSDSAGEPRKGSLAEGELEAVIGYKQELHRNRSLFTLLFQSLAIAAIPYGVGGPLISAIYGGRLYTRSTVQALLHDIC